MRKLLFGGVFAAVCIAWAQPADYFAAQSIEEIPASQAQLNYEFLYRVQPDSTMRFYKMRMTDGLYRTKKAFLWPEAIPASLRPALPLFGTSEILFNERLVLADVDAVFYRADTGLVALQPVVPPGIVVLRAESDATYQEIDRHGIQPERPLPSAIYTFGDTTKVCLLRSTGLIPKEYDPYTPERTYRIDQVPLDSFPRFNILPHFLNDGLENSTADSISMAALERKIRELENALVNDSQQVTDFLTSLRNNYPPAMSLRPYEDSTDYHSRVRVRDVEALALSSVAYSLMGFRQSMLPLRERLHQLKEIHKILAREAAFEREPRTAFLRRRFWNHMFLSATTTLGRNLPSWTTDPGPTALWGIGGRLQFHHRLTHRLSWSLHAAGGTHSWKYHDQVDDPSTEIWAGGGAGVVCPILIFPGKMAWQAEAGALGIYRSTTVIDDGNYEDQRWGTSPGFYIASSVLLTALPLYLDIRYQYTVDGFGDLQAGIGFPLPWIGGVP